MTHSRVMPKILQKNHCSQLAKMGSLFPIFTSKRGEKVRFSRKIKKKHKKKHFFCEKFWRIKNLPYICSVKRKQTDDNTKNWSIHLRARIPASHAGHRGSNPLSTTKDDFRSSFSFHRIFRVQSGRLLSPVFVFYGSPAKVGGAIKKGSPAKITPFNTYKTIFICNHCNV